MLNKVKVNLNNVEIRGIVAKAPEQKSDNCMEVVLNVPYDSLDKNAYSEVSVLFTGVDAEYGLLFFAAGDRIKIKGYLHTLSADGESPRLVVKAYHVWYEDVAAYKTTDHWVKKLGPDQWLISAYDETEHVK